MTYMADLDTIASKARKGDYYRIINGSTDQALLIETVQVGSKWTVARDAEGKLIFRRQNDEQTWVIREVLTDEEKEAEKELNRQKAHAWRLEQLAGMLARMHNMVHDAKDAMKVALDKEGFVSSSLMEDIIVAQEYKTIACSITNVMERNEDMDILEAMQHVAEGIKTGLIEGRDEPTWSGGHTFSNADRQAKIAARRKFLQGINWGSLV